MLNKFKEGLVFGGGFAISFIALWYMAAFFITPMIVNSKIEDINKIQKSFTSKSPSIPSQTIVSSQPEKQFYELSSDEQIQTATVIVLAKYEPEQDGKVKAVISQFLKKDDNVTFHYKIGDELVSASYYPRENTSYGDGLVVFFAGNPPSQKMSMSYEGHRIRSLGDMPMELFKNKCDASKA
jgi:co-chaperonin GroES (HSP10)